MERHLFIRLGRAHLPVKCELLTTICEIAHLASLPAPSLATYAQASIYLHGRELDWESTCRECVLQNEDVLDYAMRSDLGQLIKYNGLFGKWISADGIMFSPGPALMCWAMSQKPDRRVRIYNLHSQQEAVVNFNLTITINAVLGNAGWVWKGRVVVYLRGSLVGLWDTCAQHSMQDGDELYCE